MNYIKSLFAIAQVSVLLISACNIKTKSGNKDVEFSAIKSATVNYQIDNSSYSGFVAYDSSSTKKRPIVLIIHEWWGQNDYVRRRAKQLAELGYIAMAIDLYGAAKNAQSVEEASFMSAPFYKNSEMAKRNFEVALEVLKKYPVSDSSKIAAIGYCFGGSMSLDIARMGESLNAVVSFHGGLLGKPADKNSLKAKVLICHGEDDQFVKKEEVNQFKKEMDSIGADYKFVQYSGATHAFSNPDATEWGKKYKIPIAYNAQADSASWNEMKKFLEDVFQ